MSLRKYRGQMNLDRLVVSGNRRYGSVVYGYRFPSRPDLIKIGYSSRGLVRIREQSTGFPETPEVLFLIHDKRASEIEGRIHEDLKKNQAKDVMGTEWFRVSFEDVVDVSPELRRALGRERWRSLGRWISFLLLMGIGLFLLPFVGVSFMIWRHSSNWFEFFQDFRLFRLELDNINWALWRLIRPVLEVSWRGDLGLFPWVFLVCFAFFSIWFCFWRR